MEEKYGFVYIWYDKKHKRYYIGSHWGTEDDGYVCSSKWMKKSQKRRPSDFSRKILTKVDCRKKLLDEEHKWLQLIPEEQLGKRYYNLSNHHNGHWSTDPNRNKTIGQKISEANKGREPGHPKGVPLAEETRKKISETLKGRPISYVRTEETRKMISENTKRAQAEHRIGMWGRKHSDDTIQKMIDNNAMNNPEYVQKIRDVKKGIKWLTNGINRKMAVPGTDKFSNLISEGYAVI